MKRWLSIIAAAGLLLYPFAAIAADYGSQTSQTQQGPPVAQPLVREGDFAIRLAAQLNLGNPTDEATAEDVLAKAGVIPVNGWLSDYPVTPEIVGQLQESITKAAAEGKLPMNSEEATKGLNYLAAQMSLPIPAEPGSGPPEGQQAPAGNIQPFSGQQLLLQSGAAGNELLSSAPGLCLYVRLGALPELVVRLLVPGFLYVPQLHDGGCERCGCRERRGCCCAEANHREQPDY